MINSPYISCKVTRKKKSAVNKWETLTIGKIRSKSIKSSGSKACKTPLKLLTVKGKEVAWQKVTNKMVATECYWKFNTEVAISEFFEKLCHLIIDKKVKE